MLCIHCEQETEDEDACTACGQSPLVDGRFRIRSLLGRGANGTTYLTERVSNKQVVALKELLVRNAQSHKTLELFEREAKTLEQLSHSSIPRYIEDFSVETGPNVGMYLVQEFVDGKPLSEHFDEARLPPERVLKIVKEVADVLHYLHRLSPPVIHRDLKPQNIMLRKNGRVCLIDFGSVQDVLGAGDGIPTMAGTVGYMAPEQLMGHAEPASDIYGLGATMVALLAGKPASQAVNEDTWKHGLPAAIPQFIAAMMASHAGNRPPPKMVAERMDTLLEALDRTALMTSTRAELLERYGEAPRPIPPGFREGSKYDPQTIPLLIVLGFFVGTPLLFFLWPVGVMVIGGFSFLGVALKAANLRQQRLRNYFAQGTMIIGRIDAIESISSQAVPTMHYSFNADGERIVAACPVHGVPADFPVGEDLVIICKPGDKSGKHKPLTHFTMPPRRML